MRTAPRAVAAALVAVGFLALPRATAANEPASKVFLNGVPTPVHFNDGDSFRVLGGPHKNTKARLSGFNTLESYGAVHRWGDWTAEELYVVAKMGTLHARRGVWRCESNDLKTDIYGRILWRCPDLAREQVTRGLALAMSVDETPAAAELVAAQREAQAARRGIWAHGVPAYVLTSLHSFDEQPDWDSAYNRLVSTVDGHSQMWKHRDIYENCQWVCWETDGDSPAHAAAAVEALYGDEALRVRFDAAGGREALAAAVRAWAAGQGLGEAYDSGTRAALEARLKALRESGALPPPGREVVSCARHVDFNARFGAGKASCLVK
jgi:endonuclease YncB( thermonuclease family)